MESIEKDSSKVDLHNIDIAEISSRQLGRTKPLFKDLLPAAMSIEMSYMKATTSAKQAVQGASAAKQQSSINVQRSAVPEQRLLPSQMIKDEIGAFAEKLSHRSEENPKTIKMMITGKEDLVLPRLSISDQISELEQIIEGLSENVFDKQHMQIIKKEIYGLTQEIEKERKGREYKAESSSTEQSLILLRDQRLSEAKAILRDMNV